MTFWFQNFSVLRLLPIFRGFNIGFQGTFNCGILVSLIGGSGDPEKEAEEDVDGYHPTEEDYEYMDDDDFDEDDLDDEDYDLLEESDDEEGDFDEEESDDVRISDLLNETLL